MRSRGEGMSGGGLFTSITPKAAQRRCCLASGWRTVFTHHGSTVAAPPPTRGAVLVEDRVHFGVAHVGVLCFKGVPPLRLLGPGKLQGSHRGTAGRGRE